jgi:hypothetical protein
MSQSKKKSTSNKKASGIKKTKSKYLKKIKVDATFDELMNLAINNKAVSK